LPLLRRLSATLMRRLPFRQDLLFGWSKVPSTAGAGLNIPPNGARLGTRPVTRQEVALYNKRAGCWVIISGKVYDITEWDPGGAGIARMYAGK
jgi:cytochrome b involved in lipid metabolism